MGDGSQDDAEFLRSVLAASDDCIKIIDLDGRLTFMSEGGQRVLEVSDFNAIKGCPWPDFWEGEGNAEAKGAIRAAQEGRSARFQGKATTFAGNARWWDVQVSPIKGEGNAPDRILCVSRDITALKEAEELSRLLALELHHRMKNLIMMAQSVALQTMTENRTVEQMRSILSQRLGSLGRAQDALIHSGNTRAEIADIIRNGIDGLGMSCQLNVDGPAIELSSKLTLALSLAIHELATNSIKYGAFSIRTGRVAVSWSLNPDAFSFNWNESGGPKLSPPTRKGFGSRMIDQMLPRYFSGEATMLYEREGFRYALKAPASAPNGDDRTAPSH
jgi:PAS domain S-box-containing protein